MTQRNDLNRSARSGLLVGGLLAAAALAAGLIVFGSVACSGESLRNGLAGTPATPEALLADLKTEKGKIDQTTDRMMKQIDAFNASRKPGERTVTFSEIFSDDISGEQRDVLNQLLAEEKDVTYRSLLETIIADRDTIKNLQDRVLHLEQTLPDRFVVAHKGDSQHDLALEYLTGEAKLDPEKAKTLLAEVDQTDELVPGNKVWFFYDSERDAFRTYVTQGEAGQTPLAVRRAKQRQLVTERDEAQAHAKALEVVKGELETEVATLNGDVATLTERRANLEVEVSSLQQNRMELESSVDRLEQDIAVRSNSLYYHAENEDRLKDSGILSSVLKRVRDVKGLSYDQAIDLRASTTITLQSTEFGLDRIKEIRVLPAIYQEGRDFSVEVPEDGSSARLVILDPDLFRGKEVLLSVRG